MATHVREGSDIPVLPAGSSTHDWRLGRLSPMPASVPSQWELVPILSVARLESGHTPSRRVPEYWDGDIPWVSLHDSKALSVPEIHETSQTIGELGLANSSARLLPAGTVVFSRTATVGKSTILGREMATSQDFANFVCGPRLHNQYLMQLFRCLQPEWLRLMAGSTHNTIYMPVFRELQLFLPPFVEQRKIAAILSSVDETIEKTETVIAQLQDVKKAMMQELLTRGMPGRHTRFKQTEIGEIPVDWEVAELGSLIAEGPDNGIYRHASDYGSGTPIVRIDAFDAGDVLRATGLRRVRLDSEYIAQYRLAPGDILINRVNSVSHIGKAALVCALEEDTVFESNMMRLSIAVDRVLPAFAHMWICGQHARQHFRTRAKQAVAQASVNQGDVRALLCPVPSLEEQEEAVSVVAALALRVSAEVDALRHVQSTKKALTAALMSGEVRVSPDAVR